MEDQNIFKTELTLNKIILITLSLKLNCFSNIHQDLFKKYKNLLLPILEVFEKYYNPPLRLVAEYEVSS